jgi:hypothetical protein
MPLAQNLHSPYRMFCFFTNLIYIHSGTLKYRKRQKYKKAPHQVKG